MLRLSLYEKNNSFKNKIIENHYSTIAATWLDTKNKVKLLNTLNLTTWGFCINSDFGIIDILKRKEFREWFKYLL